MKILSPLIIPLLLIAPISVASERTEHFNTDPAWDGMNNRPSPKTLREIVQDFGYSATTHAGGAPGEIGGKITPDGNPAYYAKAIATLDFEHAFSASGDIFIPAGPGNTFLGFFNHATINEWRTPNSLGFRINQRGEVFHTHVEFATSKWRASAGVVGRVDKQADRIYPLELPGGNAHPWTLRYTPQPDGGGLIEATLDDHTATCAVAPELRKDGARFDRFGFLNIVKSVDSPGELWLCDVVINGEKQDLSSDPQWDGRDNRRTYLSPEVRPRFDFGFSPTSFAGDQPGEIGGRFYRGDCRDAAKLAYYGAKTGALSVQDEIHASGRIAFLKGVSDSTTLFGFFNAKASVRVNESQANAFPSDFLGAVVEGPSGEGFLFYPAYRMHDGSYDEAHATAPHIYPDGKPHTWELRYRPATPSSPGEITLALDDESTTLTLPAEHAAEGATFDRFGFLTPWIDGNGQVVYLDDLQYTVTE